MPIYEFHCTNCHCEFDCLLNIDETYEKLICPQCGCNSPKKIISTFRTNTWSTFLDKMERKIAPHKFK
jgi:putative FmdB family regulatory protein